MTLSWIQFGVYVFVLLMGFILSALKLGFMIRDCMSTTKAEFRALLELEEDKRKSSVNRCFERLDEYKMHIEKDILTEYVRKDVYAVTNDHINNSIRELKTQLDRLNTSIDEIKNFILTKHRGGE